MARTHSAKEKKVSKHKKHDKKTVEQTPTTIDVDPTLIKDVSSFLTRLKTGGGSAEPEDKPSQPKSKPPAKKVKAQQVRDESESSKSSKKQSKQASDTKKTPKTSKKQSEPDAPKAAEPAFTPAPAPEPVILPKKISLNSKITFVLQPLPQWYTFEPAAIPSTSLVSGTELASITARAAELHQQDIEAFQKSSSSHTSEASFMTKIIQSGTLSDRLSALTLLVQSGPIHNIKALEILKSMAERGKGKGGREESLKALRCVADWWVGGGAPSRKLKYFRDRPLKHAEVTDQHLLLWYFEDWLKKYFFSILQILETLSLDPLSYVRTQAMNLILTLLRDKPEQEQNLLRLLVNKLGDIDKGLCSRASHHLLQLLQTHPSMKSVIVTEIISFVLRPVNAPATAAPPVTPAAVASRRIKFDEDKEPKVKPKEKEKKTGNPHARYYATITFNQIMLTAEDREVALKLIDLYFEIFKELLGEGNGDNAADGDDDDVAKDSKGRVIDSKKKKRDKNAKGKGKEIKGAAGFTEVEDENSKLISAILTGVNRALPFAKIDVGDDRLSKQIDTLFLITHTSTFNISLQALVLIQQIAASISSRPSSSSASSSISKSIVDRFYRTLYDSLQDNRLASSSKQAMYLNLLFKSIKADVGTGDGDRVKALVRRFVQVLVAGGSGATEFIAGGLFLLGELFSTTPGLREMMTRPAKPDEEEIYDPRKRDPQYSHASASPLWELTPLLYHYHPTISLLAQQLLSAQPLAASANLSLNTLSHFLDRFVYKNAKKNVSAKGVSAMQPAASGLDGTGVKLMKGDAGEKTVNDPSFAKRREQDVPIDEVFFHKFFARKNDRKGTKVEDESEDGDEGEGEDESGDEEMDLTGDEATKEDADEDESAEGDDDEKEIWKAMKASMPNTGDDNDLMGDSDSDADAQEDEDDLPSDFENFEQALGSDEEAESPAEEDEEDADDEGLSLAEGSDDDDLMPLGGLMDYDGEESEEEVMEAEEEWGGIEATGAKRKRTDADEKKAQKKKRKAMPTFASYEDYAKMIDDGPEDDL